MKCIVTGGAGFIGSSLVKKLLNLNWDVDVVDDLSGGRFCSLEGTDIKPAHPKGATGYKNFFVCDFADPLILKRISENFYDIVFHQAAIPRVSYSVENPAETNLVNVSKTVELLEACCDRVRRFIFASSSSVYGGAETLPIEVTFSKNPKSPYALQKSITEEYCRLFSTLYDLDTVCLRYFNVFGPGQYGDSPYATAVSSWCHSISKKLPIRSDGDGTQSRDLCYIDNVVSANILAATSSKKFLGDVYNVCCGDQISNREILDYLRERYLNLEIVNAPWRAGDVMHTRGDISKTRQDLGYEPTIKFWEGLERTLEWWNLI